MRSKCFRNLTLSHNGWFPLLGLFSSSTRFVTDYPFDPVMFDRFNVLIDYVSVWHSIQACRNGMVLFARLDKAKGKLVVWEPMRDIVWLINKPHSLSKVWDDSYNTGTILCSTNHGCHSSNFWIVWIASSFFSATFVWRYSSEFRKWEDYAWLEPTGMTSLVDEMPATLIGDFLY